MEPQYDIVLFGATSFVGQILTRRMAEQHGFGKTGSENVRWAIAGRSKAKLDRLRDDTRRVVTEGVTSEAERAAVAVAAVVIGFTGLHAVAQVFCKHDADPIGGAPDDLALLARAVPLRERALADHASTAVGVDLARVPYVRGASGQPQGYAHRYHEGLLHAGGS